MNNIIHIQKRTQLLEDEVNELKRLNQQLRKENENFRLEAVKLRSEIAGRNALFLSASHDLLYTNLSKGSEKYMQEEETRENENEQEKERGNETEKEKAKEKKEEAVEDEESESESESESDDGEPKKAIPPPLNKMMFMSGSLALFDAMGKGAAKLMTEQSPPATPPALSPTNDSAQEKQL